MLCIHGQMTKVKNGKGVKRKKKKKEGEGGWAVSKQNN